jgi:O-antigen ligase
VLLVAPHTSWSALASLPVAKVAAGGAMITHVVTNLFRGRPIIRWSPPLRIAAVLLGWAIVTVPFSVWPGGAIGVLSEMYVKSLIIFWILGDVVVSVRRLRQIYWSLVLFALPLPLTALERFRSGEFMGLAGQSAPRIIGYHAPLTANPNDLALMLNVVLPLTIAVLSTTAHRLTRAFLVVVILLDVVAVIMTFSRGGFVALAVMGTVYFMRTLRRPNRRWALLAVAASLVCLVMMPAGYGARLATIFNFDQDNTGSAQARRTQMWSAINYTIAHPLVGAGIGMNNVALADSGGHWLYVHNVWLEYSVDLGLPGLILFALLFVGSLRATNRARRLASGRAELSTLFAFSDGLNLSLIAFGVSTVFYPVAYHFYFYYLAGLATAVGHIAAAAPEPGTLEGTKAGRTPPRSAAARDPRPWPA